MSRLDNGRDQRVVHVHHHCNTFAAFYWIFSTHNILAGSDSPGIAAFEHDRPGDLDLEVAEAVHSERLNRCRESAMDLDPPSPAPQPRHIAKMEFTIFERSNDLGLACSHMFALVCEIVSL